MAVGGGQTVVFVLLQHGDLAASEDGLQWEAEEKFGCGGEEGAEGVGGGSDDGVDGEEGAEEKRGGGGDEGRYCGVEEGGGQETGGDGETWEEGEGGVEGPRRGRGRCDDEAGADQVQRSEKRRGDGGCGDGDTERHEW